MNESLIFPIAERAFYLRVGGILYLALGLGLLLIAKFTGQRFWWFCGILLFSLGFVASGYIRETVVDPVAGHVRSRKGFYFLQSKRRYSFTEFSQVTIRRSTRTKQRFSKMEGKTYESVPTTQYDVVLVGQRELTIEGTEHHDKAMEWAQQIGETMKIPVVEEDVRDSGEAGVK